jgi:hypothetical protein
MAPSATGVVGVAVIPLLIWLSAAVRNHPAAACGRGSLPYRRREALGPRFAIETRLSSTELVQSCPGG